jgi:hypothetical protein
MDKLKQLESVAVVVRQFDRSCQPGGRRTPAIMGRRLDAPRAVGVKLLGAPRAASA